MVKLEQIFKGNFIISPEEIKIKLLNIKAFVFDWDGVFNNGSKDENASSSFSDVDSMGTNLLRFNYFLRIGQVPLVGIISGEKNKLAFTLSEREHFNCVYYSIKTKTDALQHLCSTHNIEPEQVAYFFDDVLDFGVAAKTGLRIMVGRQCNPLLIQYALENNLADYITHADGSNHAVREAVELLLGISNNYNETVTHRVKNDEEYNRYIYLRNLPQPIYYTAHHTIISQQKP